MLKLSPFVALQDEEVPEVKALRGPVGGNPILKVDAAAGTIAELASCHPHQAHALAR